MVERSIARSPPQSEEVNAFDLVSTKEQRLIHCKYYRRRVGEDRTNLPEKYLEKYFL